MYRNLLTVVGAAVLASAVVTAQTPTESPNSKPAGTTSHEQAMSGTGTDQAFVKAAAMGGMAEVDLGQLASAKATDEKVKAFAQKMVTDHSKANEDLKALASSKQITVPTALDAKHQATHDRLANMSGSAFDRAYVSDMLADHRKDVADFKHQAMSAKDPDVKAFAAKTLPTLQEHLMMIEDLSKEVGASGTKSKTKTKTP